MTHDPLIIRCLYVNTHVLRDETGLYLIDGGFVGGVACLKEALREKGWEREKIVGILVTHGHLDHILNVGRLARESGAWIAAPRLDAAHYRGDARYPGIAKVTGALEAIGRPLFGFEPFTPDRLLDDGDTLEIWGGLRVIGLPGHTPGHCGFYSPQRKLLFCGDLVASGRRGARLPPAIFNHDGALIPKSIAKALTLDLDGVLPNHAGTATPQEHLARLRKLAR
ncbi:MAG TPA: MBL fold metallo-hydrolase [Luteolibacter sp.]|nr:MBL fold metallo-hydrolase [Luteolibacter sp.]